MFTKEEAMVTRAIHVRTGNRCYRWRRNGQTKTWVRSPERFRLPVKYGLYAYDQITEADCNREDYHTEESCPYA